MFTIGDKVTVKNTAKLDGNDVAPPLVLNEERIVKAITLDSKGNQHLDVGVESKLNFVRSYETKENLPDGDKIHWCHPSRFEKVVKE